MRHLEEELSLYADGELREDARLAAQAHLSQCPQCRAELDQLQGLSKTLKDIPQRPLPAGFYERLARRRERQEASFIKTGLLTPALRWPAYALSGLIVATFLHNQWRGARAPEIPQAKSRARARGAALIERPVENPPLPASASQAYTNEDLRKDIELEKKRMGIRELLPPRQEPVEGLPVGLEAQESRPAYIAGETPSLLAPSLPAEHDPLRPPLGRILRSEKERGEFWRLARLKIDPPFVDYSRSLLAVLLSQDPRLRLEITGVEQTSENLLVQYRQFRQLSRAPGKSDLSVEWRVIPKSDLPVLFEEVR